MIFWFFIQSYLQNSCLFDEQMELNLISLATFSIYIVAMLAIGFYAYRRSKDPYQYFLGGRSLGVYTSALSASASDMSGWLLLGLPGYAFASGIEAVWLAAGLLVGTWLNWLLVARRLRVYSYVADNAITLPEYFKKRFADNSNVIQTISAFFILLFFLFYTSSGLVASGKLFESVFGLDYSWAVIIGTSLIVSYTVFGGFLAVSWTDLVQGLLMLTALVIVPVMAIQQNDGISGTISGLNNINPELLTLWNDVNGEPLSYIAIISLLAWGLGYFGQPHILARFKAIKSESYVPAARRIAVGWSGLSMFGALMVGLCGIVFVENNFSGSLADNETIFIVLVNALFSPVIAGILLAAILAAIMSTADSQLLVSSSALAEDFFHNLMRKDATHELVVRVGRITVVILSVIAMLIALDPDNSVLGLVAYAWAGFGSAFGPTLIFSLFWKRMNRNGALAGILVGGLVVVIWKQLDGGLFDLYEIVPGFLLSSLSIYVVSLATSTPAAKVKQDFEKYSEQLSRQH